jgi:transcriptional regulator with XRE-family HTH domain
MELIMKAIYASAGLVSKVAKKLKVDRRTVQRWRDGNTEIAEAFDDAIEANLDLAEDKLLENVKSRDNTACIFYLKCKGKKRGYVEKSQVEHMGAMSFSQMDDKEVRKQIAARLKRRTGAARPAQRRGKKTQRK